MMFEWLHARGVSSSVFCFALVAAADLQGGVGCDACDKSGTGNTPVGTAVDVTREHTIAVMPIRLADDDGSHAATVTEDQFASVMATASEVFLRGGAKITFVAAEGADFSGHVRSTLLNHDCLPRTNHPETFTKEDLNNDGTVDDKDADLICDRTLVSAARNAYALKYPANLVVFHRWAKDAAVYDQAAGHWTIAFAKVTGGYSGRNSYFVAGVPSSGGSTFLAHEMGHYLHLAHTFSSSPQTVDEAVQKVNAYITAHAASTTFVPSQNGLDVFDNDLADDVHDTPPDANTAVFTAAYGDACDVGHPSIDLAVTAKGKPLTLTLAPDRADVMSYFKGCPWPQHISKDQAYRVYAAVQQLNRRRLLHPELFQCYTSKRLGDGAAICQDLAECNAQIAARENIVDECLVKVSPEAVGATRSLRLAVGVDEVYPDCPAE